MEKALDHVADYPGYADQPIAFRANVAAYYGKLRSSRDFARRSIDLATRSDAKDRAAWSQLSLPACASSLWEIPVSQPGRLTLRYGR